MAVEMTPQGPATTPAPRVVIQLPLSGDAVSDTYAIAPDGRLRIKTPVERHDTLVTLMNWAGLLGQTP
jgi:hypothetical protein